MSLKHSELKARILDNFTGPNPSYQHQNWSQIPKINATHGVKSLICLYHPQIASHVSQGGSYNWKKHINLLHHQQAGGSFLSSFADGFKKGFSGTAKVTAPILEGVATNLITSGLTGAGMKRRGRPRKDGGSFLSSFTKGFTKGFSDTAKNPIVQGVATNLLTSALTGAGMKKRGRKKGGSFPVTASNNVRYIGKSGAIEGGKFNLGKAFHTVSKAVTPSLKRIATNVGKKVVPEVEKRASNMLMNAIKDMGNHANNAPRSGGNMWINHVKRVQHEMGISYRDAMKIARQSYRQ